MVDDLTKVVAALDAVLYLAKDFANFVFDGIRLVAGLGLEAVEVRKELLVDEVEKVIAAQRGVVVNLAVLAFRRSPRFPAVGLVEDVELLPSSAASVALSFSRASRYFKNRSQDVCSV